MCKLLTFDKLEYEASSADGVTGIFLFRMHGLSAAMFSRFVHIAKGHCLLAVWVAISSPLAQKYSRLSCFDCIIL